jgi:hypothetical protein
MVSIRESWNRQAASRIALLRIKHHFYVSYPFLTISFLTDQHWTQIWRLSAFWIRAESSLSTELIVVICVYLFFAVVSTAVDIFHFLLVRANRRLIEETVLLTQFQIKAGTSIVLLPAPASVDRLFLLISAKQDMAQNIAFLVLCCLTYFVNTAFLIGAKLFLSRSIYPKSPISFTFDRRSHFSSRLRFLFGLSELDAADSDGSPSPFHWICHLELGRQSLSRSWRDHCSLYSLRRVGRGRFREDVYVDKHGYRLDDRFRLNFCGISDRRHCFAARSSSQDLAGIGL